jgi:FixJ family two-component response regulator
MNAPERSKVCIVDDDPAVREALDALLRSFGHATSMHGSLDEFRRTSSPNEPSCMLLDVNLPGQNGLEYLLTTSGEDADVPPVVLITGYGDVPLAVSAMRAGAIDVLPKPFSDTQLISAVEVAIGKDRERRRLRGQTDDVMSRFKLLTRREREVMALVTAGLMNKQIAWRLSLSEVTVKIHRGNAMRKMKAKSLADLVRMAAVADARRGDMDVSDSAAA